MSLRPMVGLRRPSCRFAYQRGVGAGRHPARSAWRERLQSGWTVTNGESDPLLCVYTGWLAEIQPLLFPFIADLHW